MSMRHAASMRHASAHSVQQIDVAGREVEQCIVQRFLIWTQCQTVLVNHRLPWQLANHSRLTGGEVQKSDLPMLRPIGAYASSEIDSRGSHRPVAPHVLFES